MFNKVVANVQQSGCKCSTKGLQMIKYTKKRPEGITRPSADAKYSKEFTNALKRVSNNKFIPNKYRS